jgi:Rrf2 family protein
MNYFGAEIEYGLHTVVLLAGADTEAPPSGRDLAEFQGLPGPFVAKLLQKLQRAGIVAGKEGRLGGHRLAKDARSLTVFEVVEALKGTADCLFLCREVRQQCVLFKGKPPKWVCGGVCAIHSLMLQAEREMLNVLRSRTIADLAAEVTPKLPSRFVRSSNEWFAERRTRRRAKK